jgi:hypothetical protein
MKPLIKGVTQEGEGACVHAAFTWHSLSSPSLVMENIKQGKGNECRQHKSTAAMFSSSLPICLLYSHLVMPRHVLSPCYARYEHTRGIKGYVTYYLACYVRLQVQNMPGCHLRKYGCGQMGRLEEKIAAVLLYWLHSFPLACLTWSLVLIDKRFTVSEFKHLTDLRVCSQPLLSHPT